MADAGTVVPRVGTHHVQHTLEIRDLVGVLHRRSSSDRVHAAVDHQLGAGDEARFVGNQVEDAISDVLGRAEIADRDASAGAFAGLVAGVRMLSPIGVRMMPGWTELQRTL